MLYLSFKNNKWDLNQVWWVKIFNKFYLTWPNLLIHTGNHQNQPVESLHIQGKIWEEQVLSAINDFFIPAGFTVQAFTKLPYLCEGDIENPFYVLQDVVFVLRRTEDVGMTISRVDPDSKPINSECVVNIPS